MNWQQMAVIGVIVVTVTLFLVRLAKPRQKGGCSHGCGCHKEKH